jgi:uroporphyrin-III C-methyltransferase
MQQGKVYLVGAGPGDPELITVKGANILGKAEVIVYDRLANPELLSLTADRSEHLYVGKRPGKPSASQEQINRILITKAHEGKIVARLKGGDPFVFGRGGEECEALRVENIPYEVIPGISSALAAPAFAGIPVTQREIARSFTVVTGHTIKCTENLVHWEHLIHVDTLVILMGMKSLSKITKLLISHGRHADTPVSA